MIAGLGVVVFLNQRLDDIGYALRVMRAERRRRAAGRAHDAWEHAWSRLSVEDRAWVRARLADGETGPPAAPPGSIVRLP